MKVTQCVLTALSLILSACTTNILWQNPPPVRGDVQAKTLPAAASERYENQPDVRYVQPHSEASNPPPTYPAPLLASRLSPSTISVRLVVDANGRVIEVQRLEGDDSAASDSFFQAVRDTCRQWRFSPLVEVRSSPVSHEHADGSIDFEYPTMEKPLPFHLDYAFRFSQRDGKPSVDAHESASAPGRR